MFRKEINIETGDSREVLQYCYKTPDSKVVVLDADQTQDAGLTRILDEEAISLNAALPLP